MGASIALQRSSASGIPWPQAGDAAGDLAVGGLAAQDRHDPAIRFVTAYRVALLDPAAELLRLALVCSRSSSVSVPQVTLVAADPLLPAGLERVRAGRA